MAPNLAAISETERKSDHQNEVTLWKMGYWDLNLFFWVLWSKLSVMSNICIRNKLIKADQTSGVII